MGLRRQPPQDFFPQPLRFSEELLVFDEHPVQFDGLFRRELLPQQHIAEVDRIGEGRVFGKFFKGCGGIVVVHAAILALRWEEVAYEVAV